MMQRLHRITQQPLEPAAPVADDALRARESSDDARRKASPQQDEHIKSLSAKLSDQSPALSQPAAGPVFPGQDAVKPGRASEERNKIGPGDADNSRLRQMLA